MAEACFSDLFAWILEVLAAFRDRPERPPLENSYYGILHAVWQRVFQKALGFLVKPQCRFGHHNRSGKPNSTGDLETSNDRHARYSDSAVTWVSHSGEQFRVLVSEAKNSNFATNRRDWLQAMAQLQAYLTTANDDRAGQQNMDHRHLKKEPVHGLLTCGTRAYRVKVTRKKGEPIEFDYMDDFQSGGLDMADINCAVYPWLIDIRARFTVGNRGLVSRWPEMGKVLLARKDSYTDESSNTALAAAFLEDQFPLSERFLIKPQAALRVPPPATGRGRGTSKRSSSKPRTSKSREKSANHAAKDSSGVFAGPAIKFCVDLILVKIEDPAVFEHPVKLLIEVKRNNTENSLKNIVNTQLENSMKFIKTRLFDADYLSKRLAANKYVRGLAVMGNYFHIKNWTKDEKARIVPQDINWQEHGFSMDQMPEAVKIKLLTHVDPKNLPGSYI